MDKIEFTIRRAEPADAEALRRIFDGPLAMRGTLQLPFPSTEDWRKRLTDPPDGTFNLVVCVENEVIGQAGMHTSPHRARRRHAGGVGMAVRDDWQGKGAGTALMQALVDLADKWLNLARLELDVYTDNEPAIRLYQKFGFVIEGTHRQFAFRDGEYVDVYSMARLRRHPAENSGRS